VAEAKPGGTISANPGPIFGGIAPHNSINGGTYIVPIVYNHLHRVGILAPERGIVPDLAESHELAGDRTTWIFKLRPNVMIAANRHGVPQRPLDAEDVKLTLEKIGDPAYGASNSAWIREQVERFDVPDSTTFRIIMKRPYAWVLQDSGNHNHAIVPREWLVSPNVKTDAVGAGPFMLTELTEGQRARLVRNPAYYVKDRPFLDEYILKPFADAATSRTAFVSGQIDIYTAQNKDEADELRRTTPTLQSFSSPTLTYSSFWMNTKAKPWDDPRVRRAVHRATNRQEYIALIGKGEGTPIALVPAGMNRYALPPEEVTKLAPFNVGEARQLLQAAGVTEFKFAFSSATGAPTDTVNVFVRQMQAAGVKAVAEPLDPATWGGDFFNNKLTATITGTQEYPHPGFTLLWHKTRGISGNDRYDTGFTDPEVDAAITRAAGEMDEQARVAAYLDAQRLILGKDPAIFHFYSPIANTLVVPKVQNFPAGAGTLGYGGFATAFVRDIWVKA
jgi:peptide/nickel transport system substrate-binding protein